jgi:hypothetical protein
MPFKIALAPVVLMVAGFDMISFAFYVALNALTPVWLQKPVKVGGYGFTVYDNAACKFTSLPLSCHPLTLFSSYSRPLDWRYYWSRVRTTR